MFKIVVQQKHISYEFRVLRTVYFSYHISEVYAILIQSMNEKKQGRWGGGSCKKGELHMEREEAEGEAGVQGYGIPHALSSDEKNLLSL